MIITRNHNRILIKENGTEVNINDGDIIEYDGIYYKTVHDIVEMVKIETLFIGVVETYKSNHDIGIMGIYVKPLYIWDGVNHEWKKIVNYNPPKTKYFLYPHLLMLSQHEHYASGYSPLYSLMNCKNKSLDDVATIQKPFNL